MLFKDKEWPRNKGKIRCLDYFKKVFHNQINLNIIDPILNQLKETTVKELYKIVQKNFQVNAK
jgi:hypothetical protein